jgi:5'-3' exonuclease
MIDNGRETIIIIDASMMARSIIEVCRRNEETASEGYQEWRYRFIERILYYLVDFNPTEVIIALDSPPYWRKDLFKFYKASRKLLREKDEETSDDWFNYEEYFGVMETFFEKLKKAFPFKFISVPKADDIAGVLCTYKELDEYNKVLITTDQDFLQLQRFQNVYLYDPIRKNFKVSEDPKEDLLMKICQGDVGDFIPSICNKELYKDSFLNYCVEELKIAKTEKAVQIILDEDEDKFFDASLSFQRKYGLKASTSRKFPKKRCQDLISTHTLNEFLEEEGNEHIKMKFKRNHKLIDLSAQPKAMKRDIIDAYENTTLVKKVKLYEFVIKNRFNHIADNITLFQKSLKGLVR